MDRKDYLGECNEFRLPLAEFHETFCQRCSQPECTRSLYGTSLFDRRVNTWHERLFSTVPRMDSSDPRYSAIATKKFILIDPSPPYEVSSWVEPSQEVVKVDGTDPGTSKEPSEEFQEVQVPQVLSTPPTPTQEPPRVLGLGGVNTPNHGGKFIGGGPPVAPPTRDPWAAPTAPKGDVVKKGAIIRLGGDRGGVE